MRTLKKVSFDFDELTVTIQAMNSKHGRKDILPLRRNTTTELKQFIANKLPQAHVFGEKNPLTVNMIRGQKWQATKSIPDLSPTNIISCLKSTPIHTFYKEHHTP